MDSDFDTDRRHEVIEYCQRKYGEENVAQIITFGTLAARAAVRAVCRALDGVTYATQDKIAKMIPQEIGMTIQKALDLVPDFKRLYEDDEQAREIISIAQELEGIPSHTSTHAAGVLITGEGGVSKYVPTWVNDSTVVTQYNKDLLEQIGLLKMDFLGLNNLTILNDARKMAEKNHGVKIDFEELYKIEDLKPLELIRKGQTTGIFQLSSDGMTSFMKDLQPQNIEDLIIGISMYRPGPMKEIPTLLHYKRNPEQIKYQLKGLNKILDSSYGVLCYQEQCMQTVVQIAGFDKSDSDGFRKVISKKKLKLIPLYRKWFIYGRKLKDEDEEGRIVDYPHKIPGGLALGHDKKELEKFFDIMENFGKYCFNKSHAAVYAYVAYLTAWFAYYYPSEFIAGLLNMAIGNKVKITELIAYAKSIDIEIENPDINFSTDRFIALKNGNIAYSMLPKGGNGEVIRAIAKEREENGSYLDMTDFLVRTKDFINKKTFEGLVAIGCFDSLGLVRSQWMACLQELFDDKIKKVKDAEKRSIKNGKSFDFEQRLIEKMNENLVPIEISEYPISVKVELEKTYANAYLSGHPLDKYVDTIKSLSNIELSELKYEVDEFGNLIFSDKIYNKQPIRIVAILNDAVFKLSKAGNNICICQLEDLTGLSTAFIWPQDIEYLKPKVKEDTIYIVEGFLLHDGDKEPIIVIEELQEIEYVVKNRLVLNVNSPQEGKEIMLAIKNNPIIQGKNPIYLEYLNTRLLLEDKYWIDIDNFLKFINPKEYKKELW